MNEYGLAAITLLFFLGAASGQEPLEVANNSETVASAIDITGIATTLIFFVTVLLIVVIPARNYSNTTKLLLDRAFAENKELPEELQEPVSAIIKSFPQAEPLGLPRGSLRAIVLLIFSFAFVFLLFFPPEQANGMVQTLQVILAILVGFYFGSRYAESRITKPEPAKREAHVELPVTEAKEIAPEVLPEEKKKRKKREGLI